MIPFILGTTLLKRLSSSRVETGSRIEIVGSRGREKWGVIIKEDEVSVWNDEKVMEANDGNGCIVF